MVVLCGQRACYSFEKDSHMCRLASVLLNLERTQRTSQRMLCYSDTVPRWSRMTWGRSWRRRRSMGRKKREERATGSQRKWTYCQLSNFLDDNILKILVSGHLVNWWSQSHSPKDERQMPFQCGFTKSNSLWKQIQHENVHMPKFSKLLSSVYLYNSSHSGSFFSGEEMAGIHSPAYLLWIPRTSSHCMFTWCRLLR